VGGSVRDSVWDSVRSYYDSDDLSFYSFFHNYFHKNKLVWLQCLSENVTGYEFFKEECWLVRKPKTLELNEQGRLHSVKGKAIEWRDGYGFYYIHGVEFKEDSWKKVINPKVTAKTILSLKNTEQRMAVLKLWGVDKILKNAKLLDKSARGNELYLVTGVFANPTYFLRFKDTSTDRVYVEGVRPEVGEKKDADFAQASAFGLTKEEYQLLKVES